MPSVIDSIDILNNYSTESVFEAANLIMSQEYLNHNKPINDLKRTMDRLDEKVFQSAFRRAQTRDGTLKNKLFKFLHQKNIKKYDLNTEKIRKLNEEMNPGIFKKLKNYLSNPYVT